MLTVHRNTQERCLRAESKINGKFITNLSSSVNHNIRPNNSFSLITDNWSVEKSVNKMKFLVQLLRRTVRLLDTLLE